MTWGYFPGDLVRRVFHHPSDSLNYTSHLGVVLDNRNEIMYVPVKFLVLEHDGFCMSSELDLVSRKARRK